MDRIILEKFWKPQEIWSISQNQTKFTAIEQRKAKSIWKLRFKTQCIINITINCDYCDMHRNLQSRMYLVCKRDRQTRMCECVCWGGGGARGLSTKGGGRGGVLRGHEFRLRILWKHPELKWILLPLMYNIILIPDFLFGGMRKKHSKLIQT